MNWFGLHRHERFLFDRKIPVALVRNAAVRALDPDPVIVALSDTRIGKRTAPDIRESLTADGIYPLLQAEVFFSLRTP